VFLFLERSALGYGSPHRPRREWGCTNHRTKSLIRPITLRPEYFCSLANSSARFDGNSARKRRSGRLRENSESTGNFRVGGRRRMLERVVYNSCDPRRFLRELPEQRADFPNFNDFASLHWIMAEGFNLQTRSAGQYLHLRGRIRRNGRCGRGGRLGRRTVLKALRACRSYARHRDKS